MASRLDLLFVQGATFDEEIVVYADEAEEHAIDLTGSQCEIVLEPYSLGENPPVAVIEGDGLSVVNAEAGRLRLRLQVHPELFDVGLGRWYVRRVAPSGEVSFPRWGKLTVGTL